MSASRGTPALRDSIVASSIPGRLRLRVSAAARSADALAAIAEDLESWPEVLDVQARPRTGSLIVRHDASASATDTLWAALGDAGAFRPEPGSTSDRGAEPIGGPARVVSAAAAANATVDRATGGSDLRLLVPLTLGMLSLRQAARGRQRLGDAPWYALAWYAFQIFVRFHAPPTDAGTHGGKRRRG